MKISSKSPSIFVKIYIKSTWVFVKKTYVATELISNYGKKYKPKYSIRLSTKNFGYENNIKSVPLYAVFCIKKY